MRVAGDEKRSEREHGQEHDGEDFPHYRHASNEGVHAVAAFAPFRFEAARRGVHPSQRPTSLRS